MLWDFAHAAACAWKAFRCHCGNDQGRLERVLYKTRKVRPAAAGSHPRPRSSASDGRGQQTFGKQHAERQTRRRYQTWPLPAQHRHGGPRRLTCHHENFEAAMARYGRLKDILQSTVTSSNSPTQKIFHSPNFSLWFSEATSRNQALMCPALVRPNTGLQVCQASCPADSACESLLWSVPRLWLLWMPRIALGATLGSLTSRPASCCSLAVRPMPPTHCKSWRGTWTAKTMTQPPWMKRSSYF